MKRKSILFLGAVVGVSFFDTARTIGKALQLGDSAISYYYQDVDKPSYSSSISSSSSSSEEGPYRIMEDDDYIITSGGQSSSEFGLLTFAPRIVILDDVNQIQWKKHNEIGFFGNWFHPTRDDKDEKEEDDDNVYMSINYNNNITTTTSGEEDIIREFERDWYNKCDPVLTLPIRPTCNSVHELMDVGSVSFLDKVVSTGGSWRLVLKVDDYSILKVLHLRRSFNEESFHRHQIDNTVMERLTASPYIIKSFSFCGQSVITQYAPTPANFVTKDKNIGKTVRIKIARDLARGLAELHSLKTINFRDKKQQQQQLRLGHKRQVSSPPMLYFAHHDINIANTVSILKDTIVWNDFNLGIISRHYHHNQSLMCRVPIQFEGQLWRSPEEIRNITSGTLSQTQPCDIYSFGNILFQILTKHQPWTHLEEPAQPNLTHVANSKLRGKLPNIPLKYQNPLKHPENKVLWNAVQACFQMDPLRRPSALELAEGFDIAYQWSKNKGKPGSSKGIKGDDLKKMFTSEDKKLKK